MSQNKTLVLFYSKIAQPNIARVIGIVYTPPKRFHPATTPNEIIYIFCIINLRNGLNY